MVSAEEQKNQLKLSKELINDLIPIVDERIGFIQDNLHRNPGPLGEQLKRLKEFFRVLEKISCERT